MLLAGSLAKADVKDFPQKERTPIKFEVVNGNTVKFSVTDANGRKQNLVFSATNSPEQPFTLSRIPTGVRLSLSKGAEQSIGIKANDFPHFYQLLNRSFEGETLALLPFISTRLAPGVKGEFQLQANSSTIDSPGLALTARWGNPDFTKAANIITITRKDWMVFLQKQSSGGHFLALDELSANGEYGVFLPKRGKTSWSARRSVAK